MSVIDIFSFLKSNIHEFTEDYYVDYERGSVFIEVHKDYLDEVFKIINCDPNELDIIFVREFKPNVFTLVVTLPIIIDL
jgi:hypothetical protein